jgi:hypothetical protein
LHVAPSLAHALDPVTSQHIVAHSLRTFREHLKRVLSVGHDRKDSIQPLVFNPTPEQISHRAREDHRRLAPMKRLLKNLFVKE